MTRHFQGARDEGKCASKQIEIKKTRGDVNKKSRHLSGKAKFAPSQIGAVLRRSRSAEHADMHTKPIEQKEMAFLGLLSPCGHE